MCNREDAQSLDWSGVVSSGTPELIGPDFGRGVPFSDIPDSGMLVGHVQGEAVLVARDGNDVFAISAICTHYGGPLSEGLAERGTVRCPWHHACFSLRTGEALRAPALNPLARWTTERRGGLVFVTGESRAEPAASRSVAPGRSSDGTAPSSVIIVGAGAAGDAAADMLRREGYGGPIMLIGADESAPYDRPNLSKDYLAGTAPEEWIPLRPEDFYRENDIDLILGRRVAALDVPGRRVVLNDGSARVFGALLLATGSTPVHLPTPSYGGSRVYYLRTLADSRALIEAAERSRVAVLLGASFISLEVAASLRARGLEVHVVAPEPHPLSKVMGVELGEFIRSVHEQHGVSFHMGRTAGRIDAGLVTLGSGEEIAADLVVAGIGVRANDELAALAGLPVERGIVVDEYLETSVPGIFAAGDAARYPDPRTGERIRVEHWVVAQRMGQTAARNILAGADVASRHRFDAVPFFWSRHYDVSISYVGHAESWDEVAISGSLDQHDATVTFRADGTTLAVATVGRDRASLEAEVAMEADYAADAVAAYRAGVR
ncbi:MAG: Pyridine nucleotide-disulfide oxidoreductase, FAD/NAD(P)-binding domain protein [Geminicoccaceae bacterium]|nr:Pyridine nucleotide-disulfide oxidoreductase, FAD/NAD(P)-binding domain protein [Geminicoccaceae bacterium]